MPIIRFIATVALMGFVILPWQTLSSAEAAKHGGFAAVEAYGKLVYHTGVKKVKQTGTGVYEVIFKRNVESCAFFVQVGNPSPGGGSQDLTSFAGRVFNRPRNVQVRIFRSSASININHPFFLNVVC